MTPKAPAHGRGGTAPADPISDGRTGNRPTKHVVPSLSATGRDRRQCSTLLRIIRIRKSAAHRPNERNGRSAAQRSGVVWCGVHGCAAQCSAVQRSAVQRSAAVWCAVQCSAVQCSAVQRSAAVWCARVCSAEQCSGVCAVVCSAVVWCAVVSAGHLGAAFGPTRSGRRLPCT